MSNKEDAEILRRIASKQDLFGTAITDHLLRIANHLDPQPPTLLEVVAKHLWNHGDQPLQEDEAEVYWDHMPSSQKEEWKKDAAAVLDVVATNMETFLSSTDSIAGSYLVKMVTDHLRGTTAR